MFRERLERYRDRAKYGLARAFQEGHSPHEVAASFAIGIFITALPTGGLGIGLFFVFGYWWSWINKPAIFSSVAVCNPFVKPAIYVASLQVGAIVLGTGGLLPIGGTTAESLVTVTHQFVIGTLLIAAVLSTLGYAVVWHLIRTYRREADEHAEVIPAADMESVFRRRW